MDKERLFRLLERKYCSKCEIIPNLPLGADPDEIWEDILQSRREKAVMLPLTNADGDAYWFLLTNKMISASEVIVEELLEQENISAPHISSVSTIEEIYYTGFMEGAQISIQDAMEFLQSGAEPSSVEELILMNSRQAAGFAAENMYHAIDSNYLHNLAYFLTEGLDNGGGDFRIVDTIEIPSLQGEKVKLPPADMIHEQAEQFSLFLADMKTHPLIKSAAAQAWVLVVRPFPEGNERLARLLSNVILVRSGYRFFGNISISSMIARTSYDYFRAIANILRSENGADLTYFMEYYMTVLSGAINELRHRRDKRQKEIVEKEQQMAVTTLSQPHEPISETIGQQNVSLEQNNCSNSSCDYDLISVIDAMNELMIRGVSEFKSCDIQGMTGLDRQHVNRILYKLETKNLLAIIQHSKAGNVYTFTTNSPIKHSELDDALAKETKNEDPASKEEVIAELKRLAEGDKELTAKVAGVLLSFIDKGKYTFTSSDIADLADISTVTVRNCLIPLKKKRYVFCTNFKGKQGTFQFAFISSQSQSSVLINRTNMALVCFLENILKTKKGTGLRAFSKLMLDYLAEGKTMFSSADFVEQLKIHQTTVNDFLRMLADENLLKVHRKDGTRKIYTLKQKTAVPDTAISEKTSNKNTLLTKLQRIISTGGTASRQCAEVLIRFLDSGKMQFSTEDLYKVTGWDNRMIHDALRSCKRNQIIRNTSEKQGNYTCYQFNYSGTEEQNTNVGNEYPEYSDEVLKLISDLEQSNSSTKDRRIGSVLRHCLAKHMITREDYARIGAESKWSVDMQFASMLGIVTVISSDAYEIMTELASSKQRLQAEHKNTLSLLYELFGDDMFSAEMVVAQLDYSSGRVSGILHQFTWMKLLHCTSNSDHTNFYQFCVNPTDNPEYFETAA